MPFEKEISFDQRTGGIGAHHLADQIIRQGDPYEF